MGDADLGDPSDKAKMKEMEAMRPNNDKKVDDNELPTPVEEPPLAPDGGWGWVIVFSSFFISFMVDGISYSFGIIKGELDEHYLIDKSTTAWAGSLLSGFYLLVGPISSALCNKFGCRRVCIAGSIIAAVALLISGFSQNIEMLIIFYGFIGGIGFGFLYLPAIVIVGLYFDKRRSLATGIAVCGSGVGTIVIAPFASILLEHFKWRGTNIILAGVMLNGAVFAALYRPLMVEKVILENNEQSFIIEEIKKNKRARHVTVDDPAAEADIDAADQHDKYATPYEEHRDEDKSAFYSKSSVNRADGEVVQLMVDNEHDDGEFPTSRSRNPSGRQHGRTKSTEERMPMDRQDALYQGSLTALNEYKQCNGDMGKYINSVQSIPATRRNLSPVRDIINSMFDFSLLKSPTFILICVSGFLAWLALFIPFVYVPAKSELLGESIQRTSLILSVVGAINTVARVGVGYVSDLPCVDSVLVHNIGLLGCGVLTCLLCVFDSWALLMMYAGIFMAAFVTLRSIVIVELLGIQKLNNAFGLMSLCQGVACIVGSPLAAGIYDATESYNIPFIASGLMFIVAGLSNLPIRRVARWENSRNPSHVMSTLVVGQS